MLCKTTMRAALAHVLGTIGILAAFGAGAQTNYALEALEPETTGLIKGYARLSASTADTIVMSVKLDVRVPITDEEHYLVLDFGSAVLARKIDVTELKFQTKKTTAGVDKYTDVSSDISLERAYKGDVSDTAAVYVLEEKDPKKEDISIPIDSYIRLDVGGKTILGTGMDSGVLAVKKAVGAYKVDVFIYDDLGSAREAADGTPSVRNQVYKGISSILFTVNTKLNLPTVKPYLATADVSHTAGPFLGFLTKTIGVDTVKDTAGVLAMIEVSEKDSTGFVNQTGGNATDVLVGANYEVKSVEGAFKFGQFRIAQGAAECTMGKVLTLTTSDGKDINPKATTDPTFAVDATGGYVKDGAAGKNYLCVNVTGNTVPIPAVGAAADLDGYTISVTPQTAGGDEAGVVDQNAGSIDRNGTTVPITYLSAYDAYNQRLVIVNRGGQEADYWMDSFQTEVGTEIDAAKTDIRGVVPAGGRVAIRVQEMMKILDNPSQCSDPAILLECTQKTRASGILNLNAPTETIDVMTLQIHPGTGQIDTTIYRHALH